MPRTKHPNGWESYVGYDEAELRERLEHEPDFEFGPRSLTRSDDGEAPVAELLKLPGCRGEEKLFKGDPRGGFDVERWTKIRDSIQARGFYPDEAVMVWKEPGRAACVAEGNHRLRIVRELGHEKVPTSIRYFGGEERRGLVLDPVQLGHYLGDGEPVPAHDQGDFLDPWWKRRYVGAPVWLWGLLGVLVVTAAWRRRDIAAALDIVWQAAHPSNYTNRPPGQTVDMIVIHTTEDDGEAARWFAMEHPAGEASSAHYIVYPDGRVVGSVDTSKAAYHAGSAAINARSVGIELSGRYENAAMFTPAMMAALVALTVRLQRRFPAIRLDRQHIIGHNEVPDGRGGYGGAGHHTDPGPDFPWDQYIAAVQAVA